MPDNHNINENDLDALLKQIHLDENSQAGNEDLAEFIMTTDYNVAIDSEKEKEVIKRLQKNTGKGGSKVLVISVVILFLLSLLFIFLPGKKDVETTSQKDKAAGKVTTSDNKIVLSGEANPENIKHTAKAPDTFGHWKLQTLILNADSPVTVNLPLSKITLQNDELPYLIETDRLKYSKIKQMMLSKIVSFDKGFYTHVEAGKLNYKKENIITNPFYMKNTSVSNLEYKTFLADLIIQKRKQDYQAAHIKTNNWSSYNCQNLFDSYFQNEKYNDFPVVNVSAEGAKLFCLWLEEELKLYVQKNNIKTKPLQVKLPNEIEWIYAARAGYARIAFEDGYNTIFDLSENMVDKSFVSRSELIKKRVKRSDSLYNFFSVNKYGMTEKEITDIFDKGATYYNSVSKDTLHSDRMKVHAKAGFVSQMIFETKSNNLWLIGLTWKNKGEYQKLLNEFKASGSSPFVGFRPIIIDTGDSEYKNPFW